MKYCINCKQQVNTFNDYNDDYCYNCESDNLLDIIDDEIVVTEKTAYRIFDKETLNLYKFFKSSGAFIGPNKDICRFNIKTNKIVKD